eukprot:TRINITY_DN9989_c0_g1_i1.p1 TRINITY_DN9989_c0_g1~~TRINITY_DN9989_c0_g1_i1.p1  ORF type:complete len:762 (-),score=141.66 TRINITY_DN9989_c0_g1_i1:149-2434(-)
MTWLRERNEKGPPANCGLVQVEHLDLEVPGQMNGGHTSKAEDGEGFHRPKPGTMPPCMAAVGSEVTELELEEDGALVSQQQQRAASPAAAVLAAPAAIAEQRSAGPKELPPLMNSVMPVTPDAQSWHRQDESTAISSPFSSNSLKRATASGGIVSRVSVLSQRASLAGDALLDPASYEGVVWQWEHRTGFRDYPGEQSRRIEHFYRRGDPFVRLKTGKVGTTPMEIFFADMVQHDPISGRTRAVRREGSLSCFTRARRWIGEYIRYLETGRPRRETLKEYQKRRCQVCDPEHSLSVSMSRRNSVLLDGYLKKRGLCSRIARAKWFGWLFIFLVIANTMWLGVDAELNVPGEDYDATLFVWVDNLFSIAFTLEILIRFGAFEVKSMCLRDGWFCTDSVLVFMMICDTWILPWLLFELDNKNSNGTHQLSLFRLLRLLRLSRVGRIARIFPEVLAMLKGISQAFKSVVFTLFVLSILLYVFAIIFKTQIGHEEEFQEFFSGISSSMWSLLLHGTLLDSTAMLANLIVDRSKFLSGLFVLFIFLSSFTVLNLLIGILCDVVSHVTRLESEQASIDQLKSELLEILECYDIDEDGEIDRAEFNLLMKNPEVHTALARSGVNAENLVSMSDILFQEKESDSFTFKELLAVMLRMRGEKGVTVTDIIQLRDYIRSGLDKLCQFQSRSLDRQTKSLENMQTRSLPDLPYISTGRESPEMSHMPQLGILQQLLDEQRALREESNERFERLEQNQQALMDELRQLRLHAR